MRCQIRVSFVLLLLLLFGLCGTCWAAQEVPSSTRVIRVAYPIQTGLTDLDEQGDYYGYTYEYLEAIAQYTGWNYEFVQIPGDINDSLMVMLEMLKNGELDLMGSMLYSDSFYADYDYSGQSYGTVKTVLQVLANNPEAFTIDVQQDQIIRVAVLEGSRQRIQELYEYARIARLTPELVLCQNGAEMLAALETGRADAMINTSLNYTKGVRTIAEFAPKPFYFITPKNSGILRELDEALIAIDQADPNFATTLYGKYFSTVSDSILLTAEEKNYIQNVGTVRVGVLVNQPPYQYQDKVTGELRGIGLGILEYAAQEIGLQFEMVPLSSLAECQELMRLGQLDMMAGMPYSYDFARGRNMVMTRPYVTTSCVLLLGPNVDEQHLEGKAAALMEGVGDEAFKETSVMYYATARECVEAIADGRADYAFLNNYAAQYYQSQPQYSDLRIVPWSDQHWQVCFGVAKPNHQELLRILNKVLLKLPEEAMQSIIYENGSASHTFTLQGLMKSQPILCIAVISGILLLVIFILLLILYQHRQVNKQTALELEHRLLVYHLANEQFFEYHHQSGQLLFSAADQAEEQQATAQLFGAGRLPEDSEQTLKEVLLEQGTGTVELALRCGDGEQHWLRLVMENVTDSLNNPIYTIGKLQLIDQEKREKDQLLEQAQRDSLTGLYNVKTLRQRISDALAANQPDQSGALLVMDVDYFKDINDTFGHPKGDWVLRQVAQVLEESFRTGDILGRLGGDEFIVYMPVVRSDQDAIDKGRQLLERLHAVSVTEGQPLSVSMGLALSRSGQDYDELYQLADQALYEAKRNGRNQLQMA